MTNDKLERVARALGDEALKPILREMYARTAEAWLNAPKWAGEPYRNGEHDAILFERGLPVLRAHIDEAAIAAYEAEAGERERVREAWDNGHAAGFREGHRAALNTTAGEGEVG